MTRETAIELRDLAHETAKAKGFWDQDRNLKEALMLIISELAEALEAHRKGRTLEATFGTTTIPEAVNPENFEKYFKDTFEDEIADAVIRIMDLQGKLKGPLDTEQYIKWKPIPSGNIGEYLFRATTVIALAHLSHDLSYSLNRAFYHLYRTCDTLGIDLEGCIRLKLAYNATRERLHGKKY